MIFLLPLTGYTVRTLMRLQFLMRFWKPYFMVWPWLENASKCDSTGKNNGRVVTMWLGNNCTRNNHNCTQMCVTTYTVCKSLQVYHNYHVQLGNDCTCKISLSFTSCKFDCYKYNCDRVWQKGSYRPWQKMQFFHTNVKLHECTIRFQCQTWPVITGLLLLGAFFLALWRSVRAVWSIHGAMGGQWWAVCACQVSWCWIKTCGVDLPSL